MPNSYSYISLKGLAAHHLQPGSEIMVQVFLDPDLRTVLAATLVNRDRVTGLWSEPTELAAD